jgi:putative cell wall-binding protein
MSKKETTKKTHLWSQEVTEHSNALDLEAGVFTWKDPKKIAKSLLKSAEESQRRKSSPYHSAMSMLVFYINRAGKTLDKHQKDILEQAKEELRKIAGKEA